MEADHRSGGEKTIILASPATGSASGCWQQEAAAGRLRLASFRPVFGDEFPYPS